MTRYAEVLARATRHDGHQELYVFYHRNFTSSATDRWFESEKHVRFLDLPHDRTMSDLNTKRALLYFLLERGKREFSV